MPPPESADARTRAHQILTQLAAEGPGASSRDPERGLAGAIVRTTVRRWLTIRHLIRQAGQRDPDTLEPVVCASVLGGVAELVCLDGTPDPIVVDAHVESIRPYRPGATKLVNAILRRVIDLRGEPIEQADFADPSHIPLGAGHGWQLSEPISLPGDDPLAILAVRSGMPRGLIRRWAREQGLEEATRGAWHGVMQAPVVIQDIEPEQAEQLGLLAHVEPNAYVLPREANPAEIIEATGGRIQDVGSARAVDFALDLEPTTILDPCAGGGTKTDQMRRRFPNAHITAWDPDQERQDRLRRRFSEDESVTVTSRPLKAPTTWCFSMCLAPTPAYWPVAPWPGIALAPEPWPILSNCKRKSCTTGVPPWRLRVTSSGARAPWNPRRTNSSSSGVHPICSWNWFGVNARCPPAFLVNQIRSTETEEPSPFCAGRSKIAASEHVPDMRLSDLLHDRTIRVPITSSDREEVIAELISACLEAGTLTDGESAQHAVAQREQQRSTGIGHNIAIPHGRCPEVHGVAMALGITSNPIPWNAIDGLPVRIVALVVSHPSRTVEHIQSLGRVSRFLGDAATRSTLMDATASDIARMIRAEDD